MEQQAREVASKGRYGDSMLVHMNPIEVAWMHENSPTGLTINPETGQPEAFLPLLGALAGGWLGSSMGASILGGAALTGLGSFAGSMLQGDSLEQGMMTGLLSFGTAGLMGALGGGAAEAATGAATPATTAATATTVPPAGYGGYGFGPEAFTMPAAAPAGGSAVGFGPPAPQAWGDLYAGHETFGQFSGGDPRYITGGLNRQIAMKPTLHDLQMGPQPLFPRQGIWGSVPPVQPQQVGQVVPPQVAPPPPQVAPPSVAAPARPTPAMEAYMKKNPDAGMYDMGRMGAAAKDAGGWGKHLGNVLTTPENLPFVGAAGIGILGGGLDPILGGDQGTIPDPTKDKKDIPEQFPSERVALRPWEDEEEYQERLRRGQEMLYFNPVALPRNTAAEGGLVKGYANGGMVRDSYTGELVNEDDMREGALAKSAVDARYAGIPGYEGINPAFAEHAAGQEAIYAGAYDAQGKALAALSGEAPAAPAASLAAINREGDEAEDRGARSPGANIAAAAARAVTDPGITYNERGLGFQRGPLDSSLGRASDATRQAIADTYLDAVDEGQPTGPASRSGGAPGTVAAAKANAAREADAVAAAFRWGEHVDRGFQYRDPSDPGFFSTVLGQTGGGVAKHISTDPGIATSTKAAAWAAPVGAYLAGPGGSLLGIGGAVLNAMGGYTNLGPSNPEGVDPGSITMTGAGNITYEMEGPGGRGVMTNPLSIVNAMNDLVAQNRDATVKSPFGPMSARTVADIHRMKAAGVPYDLSNPSNMTYAELMAEQDDTSKDEESALESGVIGGQESMIDEAYGWKDTQDITDAALDALAGIGPDQAGFPGYEYSNTQWMGAPGGPEVGGQGFLGGLASGLASGIAGAFSGQPGTGPGGAPYGWTWGGAGSVYGSVPDGRGGTRAPTGPWDKGDNPDGSPINGGGADGPGDGDGSFGFGSMGGVDAGTGGEEGLGYAGGGLASAQPQQNPIVQGAIAAIMGNHPQPRQAIAQFVQVYGQQAFTALRQQVITDATEQQREGSGLGAFVRGQGDGLSDSIPANIDGQEPVALSDGEVVVPADVVSGLGNGSSEAGAEKIEEMGQKVRQKRTGTKKQPRAVDASQLIMGMA